MMKHKIPLLIFSLLFLSNTISSAQIKEISPFPPSVHGMTFDSDGVLYFSDTYSNMDFVSKVYTLNPPYTGTPMATEIEGQSIGGLLWHNKRLYVAFLNKNEIGIYNKDLEFEESIKFNAPWKFTISERGIFVLNYYGDVSFLSKKGKVMSFLQDLSSPSNIQYSGYKSIWISEQINSDTIGQITLHNFHGEVIDTIPQVFKKPLGLGLDNKGTLYVADNGDDKIYSISPNGKTTLLSDKYEKPICVIANDDGTIVVNTNHEGGMLLILN